MNLSAGERTRITKHVCRVMIKMRMMVVAIVMMMMTMKAMKKKRRDTNALSSEVHHV